ncbi:N-acetylmuramoyl-L-alanine amidase [Robertmurraya korlensis]|uniref:N-acetylmuramoyl-L-alanine amidase n=1 Tax=Robertmurraya korlensis TaxID=519977 RepID=UPI000824EDF8|nr:N-acetylmuramoyl-L-alanine amidase [Robertmurraya korlensis]
MVKIFLDPGHGGVDPGATGNGLQEKNINLSVASTIQNILINEYENVEVRMSRTGDQTVSLSSRTNAANSWGADFFLSIHVNAGGGTGFESYIYPNVGAPTTTYRQALHEEVLKSVNFNNRGQKQANFHVLMETTMDAVLTENGFIDNASDAEKLRNPSFLQNLARGHANGVARAFNLRRKSTPDPSPVQGVYRVQIGAFRNSENAEELSERAIAKGFQTYVYQDDGLFKVQIGAFADRSRAEELASRAEREGFDAFVH